MFSAPFFYVLVSPIVGYVCDKYKKIKSIILTLGGICCAISISFLGPAPFYGLELNLWIFTPALIFFGIFLSGSIIPTYAELTKIANKRGFQNNIKLQGLLSGIFNSSWSLGALLGPLLYGIGLDLIGFPLSSLVVSSVFIITSVSYMLISLCCDYSSITQPEEEATSPT